MKRLPVLLLIAAAAAASSAVYARECRGVEFPDSIEVQGTPLVLNGLGVRKATVFKISVYVGALYVGTRSSDPRAIIESTEPTRIVLHFLRDVGAEDLREAWETGFANNAPQDLPALMARIARLNGWMANVRSGQRMTFTRVPGTGVQVEVGDVVQGTIEGEDFSRAFLAIWLGEKPPNPELKSGLLGGECR